MMTDSKFCSTKSVDARIFITVVTAIRNDDQLVVRIIGPMNHRDALALKLDDWTADTQNIGIQHLSIGRTSSWNRPIVDWVDKPMVRMLRTQRPVYLDRHYLV